MIQQHGGNILQYESILDFSANINPLGIPESVRKAIIANIDCIEKYPDPNSTELRKKLAVHEGVNAENIVCGNGADDLIFRIVHALKPRKALVCAPSFSEYSRALSEVNCDICEHELTESSGFAVTESILEQLDSTYDICFVCTPNNPTGQLIAPEILQKLSQKCLENDIILVCDECFMRFVRNSENYTIRNFFNERCIILKAFTKLYAIPGIRLGYAVCGSTEIADRIKNSGQFWNVSSLAQKVGTAALDEAEYVRKTIEIIMAERSFLTSELTNMGAKVFDSSANFFLFKSRIGLCEKMLTEGVLIRDCQNFSGLSAGFYRIAVRTHNENLLFINALRRCING